MNVLVFSVSLKYDRKIEKQKLLTPEQDGVDSLFPAPPP